MIEIAAGNGHVFSAYRADPPDAPKGAVVVLQEVFGVNNHIRKVTDSFAAKGYVAVAPCLFDRVRKGVELGYDDVGLAEGLDIIRQVGLEHSLADVQATVNAVSDIGKVAVVGYDWGGYLAYHAANLVNGLDCAIAYYGCGIVQSGQGRRKIPTLLHFGSQDPYIPFDQVLQFRAARPDIRISDYPAGHGFACDDRDTYDAGAAEKSLHATLTMIAHRLEGPPAVTLKNAGAYASAKTDKKKKPAASDDLGPPL